MDDFYHRIFLAHRHDKKFLAPSRWRAECLTCGWVDDWRSSEDRAESDGKVHLAHVEPREAA